MFPRALLGALAFLIPGAALAGGSGTGIPETGGQGAGAAAGDAKGLSANPAAAVGVRGTELAFDAALNYLVVHYSRAPYEGTDPNNDPDRSFPGVDSTNVALVPYLAVRTDNWFRPVARRGKLPVNDILHEPNFGLGLSVSVPFGRLVHFAPSNPGRYHLVTADFNTLYVTPAIAIRPARGIRFGIGPVLGLTTLRLRQRVDLAPALQEMDPGDPPPPPESGLLEGEIFVRHARGESFGVAVGTLVDLGDRVTIGAGFISGQQVRVRGQSRVTPSLDLTLYTVGDFTLTQNLPPIANVGTRVRPTDKWELSWEFQWVGWSVNRYFHIEIENSEIRSSNADMQDMLNYLAAAGFDVNEGQVVENIFDKDQYVTRGYRDTWNTMAGVDYRWSESMTTRFQLGFDRAAIPDENVNVGNCDFDTLVIGAGTTWAPPQSPVSVGISFSQFVNDSRTIRKSRFATHGTEHEYAFPSGNGTYGAVLSRFALAFSYRF